MTRSITKVQASERRRKEILKRKGKDDATAAGPALKSPKSQRAEERKQPVKRRRNNLNRARSEMINLQKNTGALIPARLIRRTLKDALQNKCPKELICADNPRYQLEEGTQLYLAHVTSAYIHRVLSLANDTRIVSKRQTLTREHIMHAIWNISPEIAVTMK